MFYSFKVPVNKLCVFVNISINANVHESIGIERLCQMGRPHNVCRDFNFIAILLEAYSILELGSF